MWLGVLFLPKRDGEELEQDSAIVIAYAEDEPFTVGGPVTMVPQTVVLLRAAARDGGGLAPPRCCGCGAPLEVPPLDEWVAACVSA